MICVFSCQFSVSLCTLFRQPFLLLSVWMKRPQQRHGQTARLYLLFILFTLRLRQTSELPPVAVHHSFSNTRDKASERNGKGAFLSFLNLKLLSCSDEKKTLSATSIHDKPPATHACCVAAKPWLPPSLSSADTDWSCCPLNRWKQSINGSVMLRPEPLQQSSRLAGVNCAASDCLSEKFFNLQISTFTAYIKRCHICSRQVLLQWCKKKLVSTSPDAN